MESAVERNRAFAAAGGHRDAAVFPNLGLFVITCCDPRVDPAHVLGLGLGDAIVVRNFGGRVTPEVINDVAFIGQLAESVLPDGPLFEVAVIHHTQCGTGALADDPFRRRYAERIGADESTASTPSSTPRRPSRATSSASNPPPPSLRASPCPGTSTTSARGSCRRFPPRTKPQIRSSRGDRVMTRPHREETVVGDSRSASESSEQVLRSLYEAFNARDIDAVLAAMSDDVDWPNAWEGGRVRGKEAIRAYWMRQWTEIDPHVEPVAITTRADGRLAVDVNQVVRGLDGNLLSEGLVVHVYTLNGGWITNMDVEEPQDR